MLALTRRINEEVVIGDPDHPLGVIRVVSVHGDKVRLSFDFPRDVKINRRELADLKKNGGDSAGGGPAGPPTQGDPTGPNRSAAAKNNGNGNNTSKANHAGGNGQDINGENIAEKAASPAPNESDSNHGAA